MATGGTIQYGIKFNVDSAGLNQLKQELKSIQDLTTSQYQALSPNASSNTKQALEELKAIKKTASEVEGALQKALNPKLGTTNIKIAKQELSSIGFDKIYTQLSSLGPTGEQAFRRMASSISLVKEPVKETSKLLDSLAESFGNTIRWSITSSVWQTMTGSLQKAWQYAKNLDTSLNDIRIVSGQSADQMERMAVQANRTAQALGKTTLDYTKAALIYYQQGLSEQEVEARTDVTLKLANVLNTSAQDVSDYMTAIWNNFDNGSKSLEHYADVITALGASTAASSEEIATGLEKFAAVADTVGLSYEYATTALATVVAQTRQSAETVGTAFKTIFARIQDLELGKTLEDGTTLGQYAEALQKVGISIKDSSGELKNMDDILQDMGSKWQNLTKAQQVALAQNVAGTRQYTQLVALMDNWDKFGENLITASNAEGTLQKQQDIYMESTEAHLNKLTASVERLMDELIDNKTINGFIDSLTGLIELFNGFIESIGGGGNALLVFGALATQIFNTQISRGIVNASDKVKGFVNDIGKNKIHNTINEIETELDKAGVKLDEETQQYFDSIQQGEHIWNNLTTAEKESFIQQTDNLNDLITKQKEYNNELQKSYDILTVSLKSNDKRYKNPLTQDSYDSDMQDKFKNITSDLNKNVDGYKKTAKNMSDLINKYAGKALTKEEQVSVKAQYDELYSQAKDYHDKITKMAGAENVGGTKSLFTNYRVNLLRNGAITGSAQHAAETFQSYGDDFEQGAQKISKAAKIAGNELEQEFGKKGKEAINKCTEEMGETIKQGQKLDNAKIFTNLTSGAMMAVVGFQSLTNITKVWGDETLSTGQKVSQTITSIVTGLPALLSGLNLITKAIDGGLFPAIAKVSAAILANPIGLAITAILAAIAVIYVITSAVANWADEEGHLNQQLEKNKQAVIDAQDAYKELNNTINSYKNAREKIDSLTEGTFEFYEAITAANEQAQKLIDTLGLAVGTDYTLNPNGLLEINETALNNKLYEKQQETYRAQLKQYETELAIAELKANKTFDTQAKNIQRYVNETYKNQGLKINNTDARRIIWDANFTDSKPLTVEFQKRNWLDDIMDGFASTDKTIANGNKSMEQVMSKALSEIDKSNAVVDAKARQRTIAEFNSFATQQQNKIFSTLGEQNQNALIEQWNKSGFQGSREARQNYVNNVNDTTKWLLDMDQGKRNIFTDFYGGAYQSVKTGVEAIGQGDIFGGLAGILFPTIGGIGAVFGGLNETAASTSKGVSRAANKYTETSYQDAIQELLNRVEERNINLSQQGFNSTSQKYITGAIESAIAGNLEGDYLQLLTKEELNAVAASKDLENISQEAKDLIRQYQETALPEGERSDERKAQDLAEYNQELKEQAEISGTTTSALKLYAYAMYNADKAVNEYTKDSAAAAAESYKFNKTYNEARDIFDDNKDAFNAYIKALKNGKKVSYDIADGAGAIVDKLSSLGIILNEDQLKDDNVIKLIKQLLTGTEKEAENALDALQDLTLDNIWDQWNANVLASGALTEDTINKLKKNIAALDNEQITGQTFSDLLKYISNAKMDYASLLKFLDDNHIQYSIDDIEPLNIEENPIPETTQTVDHSLTGTNPYTGQPIEGAITWRETTTNVTTPYYTLGKKANIKGTGGSKSNVNTTVASSGKNKKSKSSNQKESKDTFDRYHQVNTQITKVTNNLKKLETEEKKALGGTLLKNLQKQWEQLNKQIQNYNQKLKIAQQEQAELRKKLSSQGVNFNSDGTVANYIGALNAAQDKLNKAIKKYNKSKTEKNKKAMEAAQEVYNQFKTDIDRYDELTVSVVPELAQQSQETLDSQIENLLKQTHVKIDLVVDINDIKINWNDFKAKVIQGLKDDDIEGQIALAQQNSPLIENDMSEWAAQIERDITSLYSAIGTKDEASYIERLKEDIEGGKESYQKYADLREQSEELYIQALQKERNLIQEQLNLYAKINERIDHNRKLVQLIYGDKAYDKLLKYNELQIANNRALLQASVEARELARQRYNEIEQAYKDGKVSVDILKEAEQDLLNKINEASNQLNTNIEFLKTNVTDAANAIKQAYEQQATGAIGGLDYVEKEWNLINKYADQYLDTINRLSGENQLESKYAEAIEKATSPSAQKKLRDAMESEMKALREKDKLSQYDLDRANKKYQLTLAQIALEEAQDNKTTMRLRRDSQGNYRYQYVADEANIEQLKANAQKAYDDLYNFDKAQWKTTSDTILTLYKEYRDALVDIATNTSIDEQQKLEQEKQLYEKYYGANGLIAIAQEQAMTARNNVTESAFMDLAFLYNEDLDKYLNMTEAEKDSIMEDLIPAWKSLAAEMAVSENLLENMAAMAKELSVLKDDYNTEAQSELDISETNMDKVAAGEDESIDFINGLISGMDDVVSKQDQTIENAWKLYEVFHNNVNPEAEKLVSILEKGVDFLTTIENKELTNLSEISGNGTTSIAEVANSIAEVGAAAENTIKATFTDKVKQPSSGNFNSNKAFQQFLQDSQLYSVTALQNRINQLIQERGLDIDLLKVDGLAGKKTWAAAKKVGFASGGYTGDWNDGGRLAFLHQKELVLNASDTQNILAATQAMRQAMVVARTDGLVSSGVTGLGGNALEQDVHIEANFPNVSSSYEIEEALKNLVNAAAQRRRKLL